MWGLFLLVCACLQVGAAENIASRIIADQLATRLDNNGQQVVATIARYLDDHENRPVAILVQESGDVHRAALYTEAVLRAQGTRREFWLMKYNSSGVSNILAQTGQSNAADFVQKIEAGDETVGSIGMEKDEGNVVFFSLLKAVRILPPGAGILVFADRKIQDEDLAHLAIKEIIGKQISIFTIWQGLLHGDEKLLREASILSHGGFFVDTAGQQSYSNYFLQQRDDGKVKSIVAHQANVHGRSAYTFPIDKGSLGIHISLTGVNEARLQTPNGYLIDLLNVTDVGRFSRGSYAVKAGEINEIQLNTAHDVPTPVVGIWRLDAAGEFAQTYNLTVSIQNDLVLGTQIIDTNKNQADNAAKVVKVDLQGNFANIHNITIVDQNGQPIRSLHYNGALQTQEELDMEIETFSEKEINIKLEDIPRKPVYIRVDGKDKDGNQFVRMSYLNRNINRKIQPVSVELGEGSGSQLLLGPNMHSNIYFEVTNNKDHVLFMKFMCTDDKYLLKWLRPHGSLPDGILDSINDYFSAWVSPGQTVVVTLAVFTRPNVGVGTQDFLTFTAFAGMERFVKSAVMTVGNNREYDDESPHMWHTYTSDCLNVLLGRCQDYSWSIKVTAQDRESGLLKLTSSPPSLYFPQSYTSGTKEEVHGFYIGSCCEPTIQLTAIDLANNRRTYTADAYKSALGPGAIAAIVLGILLLIIIIIVLVCIFKCGKCAKCRRKQSDSMDLPPTSYRGPANSASTPRY